MIQDLFILNGYGQFVWPAFMFTFISCFFLFLRTKKELQRQEKMYINEFKQLQTAKIKTFKIKESAREILSGSSV
jgi:heme exporter protein D